MSKYTPLQAYLSGQSELEGVADFALPAAAPYRAWASHPAAAPAAWLVVGFRAAQAELDNQTLRLVRAGEPLQLRRPASDAPVVDALRSALAGTVRFVEAEDA